MSFPPALCAQVTRQKLPKDWHKRLQAILAKANEAMKETPRDALTRLPGGPDGAPLDYSRAVLLRNALASNAERGLFGGLTGIAATWDKVVKAYENQGWAVLHACDCMELACSQCRLCLGLLTR